MIVLRNALVFFIAALFSVSIAGCERQGPMERAGERADEAVDSARDAFTRDGPAERAGERVDDAVDNMRGNGR